MSKEIAQLNSLERTELRNRLGRIRENADSIVEDLTAIYTERLWREHKSFRAFIKAELPFEKSRAYQLLQSVQIQENVSTRVDTSTEMGGILPANEAQRRPLAKLKDPEQQANAWKDAVEAAGGQPTGPQVEEVVDLYLADNEAPDEAEAPDDEVPWSPENDMVDAEPTTEERMIQAARKLNALSRAIQAHSKEAEALNDPHLDDIRLQILKSQLRAAGGTLLACRGVQICKCVRGCKSCRKSGWLTKDVAETMAE